ncbi:MAG: hypothetical protein PHT33_03620 [bacterium]|nr:hypothetical protein [bacterium]
MPDMQVGYGEQVITPPLGVELTGYGYYLERRTEEVADDLKVRALYISQGQDAVILISCDLLSLSVEFTDERRRELAARYNLPLSSILLACTHTHAGPAIHDLPGLGEVDPGCRATVSRAISEAAQAAWKDCRPAEMSYIHETVTPIGYNRRMGGFVPIDPILKTIIFTWQDGQKIYLSSYACHPVVLGLANIVSADWPGALIARIEEAGHQGMFLQGFCGDVNPVSRMRGMGGSVEDLRLYGDILYRHIETAQSRASAVKTADIRAVEHRVRLPLDIPPYAEIKTLKSDLPEYLSKVPGYDRFIDNWIGRVTERFEEIRREQFLHNVPIQAIALGEMTILGLPGEVFSEYSLKLAVENRSPLMTVGYSGGNVGYLPAAAAYDFTVDYACYQAPRFYGLFPFDRNLETVMLRECERILRKIEVSGD